MTPLVIILVLVPVVICNAVNGLTAKMAVIISATSIFLTILSFFTRGGMLELAIAGVTYTTVLVVFI